jgi:hypothetical protein
VSGEAVSLTYADVAVLQGWRRGQLRKVELVVQVRHEAGIVVPEIEDMKEDNDNYQLIRRWIE